MDFEVVFSTREIWKLLYRLTPKGEIVFLTITVTMCLCVAIISLCSCNENV